MTTWSEAAREIAQDPVEQLVALEDLYEAQREQLTWLATQVKQARLAIEAVRRETVTGKLDNDQAWKWVMLLCRRLNPAAWREKPIDPDLWSEEVDALRAWMAERGLE